MFVVEIKCQKGGRVCDREIRQPSSLSKDYGLCCVKLKSFLLLHQEKKKDFQSAAEQMFGFAAEADVESFSNEIFNADINRSRFDAIRCHRHDSDLPTSARCHDCCEHFSTVDLETIRKLIDKMHRLNREKH